MTEPFRVMVFGKKGCPKCSVLNQRLDKLLATEKWQDFKKERVDVETEDGLVTFCEAECVNPQRIPAMMVTHREEPTGEYVPLPNPSPGLQDDVCKKSRLFLHLGLQTDYTEEGKGIISPRMIETILGEARDVCAVGVA